MGMGHRDHTAEQLAADDALELAIKRRDEAYGARPGVLLEYVVMTSYAVILDDGSEATGTDYYSHARTPIHRMYGLMTWCLERARATYVYGERNSVDPDEL